MVAKIDIPLASVPYQFDKKFIVIKASDIDDYMLEEDSFYFKLLLREHLQLIEMGRARVGKPANNNYLVVNTGESYREEVVNVLERNGHWDGTPSQLMKYYELQEPSYALIMARSSQQALALCAEQVKSDGVSEAEIKPVSAVYAAARYSRAVDDDQKEVNFTEVMDVLQSNRPQVLIYNVD